VSRQSSSVIAAERTIRSSKHDGCFSWLERGSTKRPTKRLGSLLDLGDPNAEVSIAHRVKERLRDFYKADSVAEACLILEELKHHCAKKAMPPEVQRLGRTITKWFDKLCNFHVAKMSNGPTEALNNLIKRIKRIGFGFRNFENYRIRALLYAGKPNWRVLASIVVR
jgi:transposase